MPKQVERRSLLEVTLSGLSSGVLASPHSTCSAGGIPGRGCEDLRGRAELHEAELYREISGAWHSLVCCDAGTSPRCYGLRRIYSGTGESSLGYHWAGKPVTFPLTNGEEEISLFVRYVFDREISEQLVVTSPAKFLSGTRCFRTRAVTVSDGFVDDLTIQLYPWFKKLGDAVFLKGTSGLSKTTDIRTPCVCLSGMSKIR